MKSGAKELQTAKLESMTKLQSSAGRLVLLLLIFEFNKCRHGVMTFLIVIRHIST